MRRLRKLTVPLWVRALVSLGLIALVVSQLHVEAALRRVSAGDWQWFVLAGAGLLGALAVGAWRWHLFLRSAGIARSPSHTARVYAIGAFANSFLPTAFGGDALRIWLAGPPGTRGRAAVTVIVDRATMLASVIAFAWIALAAAAEPVPARLVETLAVVTVLAAAAGALVVGALWLVARRNTVLPSRARGWLARGAGATRACFRGHVPWQTTVLGLAYEALAVLSLWLVARSLHIDVSFVVLAVSVPVVLVLTAVPISLGGLGVREGSYVVLLHQAGVSTTDAALLSVSSTVLFALVTLPGAFALLSSRDATGDALPQPRSTELTAP